MLNISADETAIQARSIYPLQNSLVLSCLMFMLTDVSVAYTVFTYVSLNGLAPHPWCTLALRLVLPVQDKKLECGRMMVLQMLLVVDRLTNHFSKLNNLEMVVRPKL